MGYFSFISETYTVHVRGNKTHPAYDSRQPLTAQSDFIIDFPFHFCIYLRVCVRPT